MTKKFGGYIHMIIGIVPLSLAVVFIIKAEAIEQIATPIEFIVTMVLMMILVLLAIDKIEIGIEEIRNTKITTSD